MENRIKVKFIHDFHYNFYSLSNLNERNNKAKICQNTMRKHLNLNYSITSCPKKKIKHSKDILQKD